jgi:hypothetical protein
MNIAIFSNTKRRLLVGLSSLCFTLLAVASHADNSFDIDQLMQALASTQSGHANFIEKKNIAVLDKPVESSGELFYTAPDRLEKRTLKPKPESMLLEKDKLTVEQRGRKHVLSLQSYPEIAAFIDSIRGTLAGDRKALEKSYKLSLSGTQENWTLTLLPSLEKMKKVVSSITISGVSQQVQTIEIKQADGDSSVMTITPVADTPVSTQ